MPCHVRPGFVHLSKEDVPSIRSGYEDYKADLERDPHAFALMFMQADEETSEITASALPFRRRPNGPNRYRRVKRSYTNGLMHGLMT